MASSLSFGFDRLLIDGRDEVMVLAFRDDGTVEHASSVVGSWSDEAWGVTVGAVSYGGDFDPRAERSPANDVELMSVEAWARQRDAYSLVLLFGVVTGLISVGCLWVVYLRKGWFL